MADKRMQGMHTWPGIALAMDKLTPAERSQNMSRIHGKDTGPELTVRKILWRLGVRYRLHRRDLPGKPDIVIGTKRKIIFVHGCFWHRHLRCKDATLPKTHIAFWRAKLDRNAERDAEHISALIRLGWDVQVVWECQTRDVKQLATELRAFIGVEQHI